MTKSLLSKLNDAKTVLDQVELTLGRHPGRISVEAEKSIRAVTINRANIAHWVDLVKSREAALRFLGGLERDADADDSVNFGANRVKFHLARFLGVQAYVATSWALADRVTGLVGRVLCTQECGLNETSPAQLVPQFIQQNRKKSVAAALYESIKRSFGWPIGISYALRNHFIHDGGQQDATDFFEGPTAGAAFRISEEGWNRIEKKALETYFVEPSMHRASWPTNQRDDLRELLIICEREMDDALGVLLGSACGLLRTHVGLMLGEDS